MKISPNISLFNKFTIRNTFFQDPIGPNQNTNSYDGFSEQKCQRSRFHSADYRLKNKLYDDSVS